MAFSAPVITLKKVHANLSSVRRPDTALHDDQIEPLIEGDGPRHVDREDASPPQPGGPRAQRSIYVQLVHDAAIPLSICSRLGGAGLDDTPANDSHIPGQQ